MPKAFDCAVRLLARREHGACELATKLVQRGFSQTDIDEAIARCQSLGFQSDVRFVEALCALRIRQGCGPLKILQELQAKQIARELIDNILGQEQDNWLHYAQTVWDKKYKKQRKLSYIELQKAQRFLLYRGFPTDVIAKVVKEIDVTR
ncbi:recombination regulator RecX [Legionella jamestowniensis]|uniref:Regulatory protein RecX n=1 Tax=Legionella jamestowniensis TaxID=455 RepID=A0A0W0UWE7_9GAMM|nr:recombination regulator RecX [Legionella jamestowniensis]KTD12175.1 recombination regulator RecX [Legionella jamestowniensis]OCH98648.1 recombination regulator RecX [Legionella jamestowniensis]SFL75558.1 regulatory protein [Legionella jamestowniensis DSM 19215]